MAGIYIHIPFCRKKCAYCNFFSLATTRFREAFTEALLREIDLTRDYLNDEPIETIYFGGGTPSLLNVSDLQKIIEKGYRAPVTDHQSPITEITLELNPEDVTPDYLALLSQTSVNRLSLGVQSFHNEDLIYLGRNHTARQAKEALQRITHHPSISLDLIYGIPTLSNDRWWENLRQVIGLGIPHLSAYALTVEPRTPLAWRLAQGAGHRAQGTGHRAQGTGHFSPVTDHQSLITDHQSLILPVSEDQAAEQFGILMELMEQAGYVQYEISNFCLPGYKSRHNSSYWLGIPYLGLGPSAHSFNGVSRRWNPSNLTKYIQGVLTGSLLREEEILTPDQHYNEYVMTSLRTVWGCEPAKIREAFGLRYEEHFRKEAARFLKSGYLEESDGLFRLTRQGKFLADGIAAAMFMV